MSKTTQTNGPGLQFEGIIPPMITPLRGPDELDLAGLERLITHIVGGGVHGLFILGTTGEGPSLSYRLRRELIDRVCGQVGGAIPVLVGITDTSFIESLKLAEYAAKAGAAAVVCSAPYYFPAGQPELIEYFEVLTRETPLPLMLYNMPQMTKVEFEIDTVRHLTGLKKIAGIKDSSGNFENFERILELKKLRPDWRMFIGPEHLLAKAVHAGGDGGVNGGANIMPALFVSLYEAAKNGNARREAELQSQAMRLSEAYRVGRHASSFIKGVKCACSLLGLCDDFMAEPFSRFNPPERQKVAAVLESLSLLPVKK